MFNFLRQLQNQVVQTHTLLAELSPGDEAENNTSSTAGTSSHYDVKLPAVPIVATAPAAPYERKKPTKKRQVVEKAEPAKVVEKPSVIQEEEKHLTLQEQEILTDTINKMASEHLPGVIQIIRESAKLSGDEDEIDLEIDQLDTATQRRLLKHVSKFIKPPKRSKGKSAKKSRSSSSSSNVQNKQQKSSSDKGNVQKNYHEFCGRVTAGRLFK